MNPVIPPQVQRNDQVPTHKRYDRIESIVDTDRVQIPDVVVILGSGPKGRSGWPLIPANAYVIAVNEGVNICIDHPTECAFVPTMWVVNDHNVLETTYFPKANKNFHGIRAFGDRAIQMMRQKYLYTRGQIDAVREGRIFSIPRGPFHKDEQVAWFHDPLTFKPGGTVAAAALWIACIKGPAKRVYLCGIDMSKDLHYSNTKEPAQPDPRHGLEWGTSRPALDSRIMHYKSIGMEIYTISETKLQTVEMRERVE